MTINNFQSCEDVVNSVVSRIRRIGPSWEVTEIPLSNISDPLPGNFGLIVGALNIRYRTTDFYLVVLEQVDDDPQVLVDPRIICGGTKKGEIIYDRYSICSGPSSHTTSMIGRINRIIDSTIQNNTVILSHIVDQINEQSDIPFVICDPKLRDTPLHPMFEWLATISGHINNYYVEVYIVITQDQHAWLVVDMENHREHSIYKSTDITSMISDIKRYII